MNGDQATPMIPPPLRPCAAPKWPCQRRWPGSPRPNRLKAPPCSEPLPSGGVGARWQQPRARSEPPRQAGGDHTVPSFGERVAPRAAPTIPAMWSKFSTRTCGSTVPTSQPRKMSSIWSSASSCWAVRSSCWSASRHWSKRRICGSDCLIRLPLHRPGPRAGQSP